MRLKVRLNTSFLTKKIPKGPKRSCMRRHAALSSSIRHRLAELAADPGSGLGQLLAVDVPHLLLEAAGGALGPEARDGGPPVGRDRFPAVLLLSHHSLDTVLTLQGICYMLGAFYCIGKVIESLPSAAERMYAAHAMLASLEQCMTTRSHFLIKFHAHQKPGSGLEGCRNGSRDGGSKDGWQTWLCLLLFFPASLLQPQSDILSNISRLLSRTPLSSEVRIWKEYQNLYTRYTAVSSRLQSFSQKVLRPQLLQEIDEVNCYTFMCNQKHLASTASASSAS